MTLSPFHTHCTFCDGKNTAEEMVLEAIRLGCPQIGFSSHSYMAHETRWGMPFDVEKKYKVEILRLKDKYSHKIKIFMGIEYDWYSDFDISDYDYVIGSVHYVKKGDCFIPLDETADHHKRAIRELYNGDTDALAEEYYSMVSRLRARTGCDIIAHLDLITKFNEGGWLFDVTHPRYQKAALEALDRLAATEVVMEINTGAMSRGYRTAPYPDVTLLGEMARRKIPICITSDAHSAKNLVYGFSQAARLAKSCGYRECMYWTKQGFVPGPMPE